MLYASPTLQMRAYTSSWERWWRSMTVARLREHLICSSNSRKPLSPDTIVNGICFGSCSSNFPTIKQIAKSTASFLLLHSCKCHRPFCFAYWNGSLQGSFQFGNPWNPHTNVRSGKCWGTFSQKCPQLSTSKKTICRIVSRPSGMLSAGDSNPMEEASVGNIQMSIFLNRFIWLVKFHYHIFASSTTRTEVLPTPSSTWPGFELMTSRSWQYIWCHWDACSNHSTINDFIITILIVTQTV